MASPAGPNAGPGDRGHLGNGPAYRANTQGAFLGRRQHGGGGYIHRGGARGGAPPRPPPQVFAPEPALAGDMAVVEVEGRASTVSDDLVAKFQLMPVRDSMPLRPGYGTLGIEVPLWANFLPFSVPKSCTIYDYAVSIEPRKQAGVERRKRIFQLLESHQDYSPYVGHIAHDSSQRLVSAKLLPEDLSINIQYCEEEEGAPRANALEFTVSFQLQRTLDMDLMNKYLNGDLADADPNLEALFSALNLVLQHRASSAGVRVGKNKYFLPSSTKRALLGPGLEARSGFFVSARPTVKQLMVNVNPCMAAFYCPGNLADRMIELCNSNGGMPLPFEGIKVTTQYHGHTRKYKIFNVMDKSAAEMKFYDAKLGDNVTVQDFFQREYNVDLKHATMPVPVVDVGRAGKPVYLPAELCHIIANQPFRGKLGRNETSQMIKWAARPPAENARTIIHEGLPSLGLQSDAPSSMLGSFGIKVSSQMTVVPGRILPPPRVTYHNSESHDVREGSWNLRHVEFHAPASVPAWAVLLVQAGKRGEFNGVNDPELDDFLKQFTQTCKNCGMSIDDQPEKIVTTSYLERIEDKLRKTFSTQKPSFILVLLSSDDSRIYSGIKCLCDVTLGIHTVHMLLAKAKKKQVQYFANVALKLNAKLGGTNHLLDAASAEWLTEEKTMLVGIDVTHPGPSSLLGTPSIAAVVASVDDTFSQFPASLMLQKPDWNKEAKEVIPNPHLAMMMGERLRVYKARNGCLPERVLVYRDGVSEGQYAAVLEHELAQILDAFTQFSDGQTSYRPKLTIVICGKRHHARLYPTHQDNATQNGNTRPGTVVDRGITDIYNNDFYLQAHAGLQGTVKPTHYVVIHDENHYSADVLQQGTHTTSYLYVRATKAVSLVPPAYYADLACERARCYLHGLLSPRDNSFKGKGQTPADREEEKKRVYNRAVQMWGNGVHEDLKETMFYI
ncbi:Piwi-domain-containing protein [Obba rivulosa]|uniref:Piwi-domain-containing protein n=1 Tax=Obba rivulosa TaxID=1052685 RepID=A0A8E2AVX2_9APHY|nr:Piwi-domain-containing protein [Obba rivulosa]